MEFVSDAEPTMKSLLASVQLLRQHLGYPTVVTHSRPGDKGRTAQIEEQFRLYESRQAHSSKWPVTNVLCLYLVIMLYGHGLLFMPHGC